MKTCTILLLLFFLTLFVKATGQNDNRNFKRIDSIVLTEQHSKSLFAKLDALKSEPMSSSRIELSFDRDIDFSFKHTRIELLLSFDQYFQIDLLTHNDSIIARTVKQYYGNPQDYSDSVFDSAYSEEKIAGYLTQRNQFYKSKKTAADIIKEISQYRVYAFYCGEANSLTEDGKHIQKLAKKKSITKLFAMLQSSNVETQAYGVSGFMMLKKKGIAIPADAMKIIENIRTRNSETVTCSGCLSGLIQKVYKEK